MSAQSQNGKQRFQKFLKSRKMLHEIEPISSKMCEKSNFEICAKIQATMELNF